MRPHVLIIVENLPVPFDRRVWMEATSLVRRGYEVSVICPQTAAYPKPREELEGVRIYRHPMPPELSSVRGYLREYSWALWGELKLAWQIWKERPFQVIHACNPPDLIFLVALPFKLFGRVKFLFDQHDPCPEFFAEKFKRRGIFYHAQRLTERLTFALADVVIATNESMLEYMLPRSGKSRHDFHVVRSSPDLSRFRRLAPLPELKRGRRILVGNVGVMREQDGLESLVDAAAHLVHAQGRRDLQFCVVGDGPGRERIEKRIADKQLGDYFELVGLKSGDELMRHLSTFDIAACPIAKSLMSDLSTANKVLEMMSLGIPVVQFDVAEGQKSAGDAALYVKSGDVVGFADAIARLADDEDLRRKLAALGPPRLLGPLGWPAQEKSLLAAYRVVAPLAEEEAASHTPAA